jgi:hypothetical protein
MKTGTGNDPFADDEESDADESDADQVSERDRSLEGGSGEDAADTVPSEGRSESELPAGALEEGATDDPTEKYPYAIRRDSVKEGRKSVMFELRDEYRGVDEDIREVLAERWGKAERDIAITDVREAMVAISDRHIDEIAAVMEEWGCDA